MLDKYKVVIFDWDGTIMDSISHIVQCVQQAAKSNALPVPDEQSVKNIIGLSLPEAFSTLYGKDKEADFEQFRENYKAQYIKDDDVNLPLFDYVDTLLTSLCEQNVKLSVATGKGRRGLDNAMHRSGLAEFFSYSRTSDEALSKPAPDMLLQTARYFNVHPNECIMIGDSIHDLNMANNAGMDSIGVSFGAHSKSILTEAKPLTILDCYSHALQWLK
ncbi:HAD family hydrolase [Planctobacterium marinum]|uniref:Haloacid dehalogenase n=1 Tax=Planctobacterium marinum TaxID=1631968 RepID=A0AA48HK02_9ALTE|nr:haloacid dehalogenase [Planctobacterium marinum]